MQPYICSSCGTTHAANALVWRCDCGGYLDVAPGAGLTRADIDSDERSLWRYRKALHLESSRPSVSFGEGLTPLVPGQWGGEEVLFKLDFLMPSGSFKDRGSALMINRLAELGVKSVLEDSSGNGGASVAAYSAAAGIDCRIYVPASTSAGKVIQTRTYGAELVKVPGTREDTSQAALAAAQEHFYASHNWHPLFIEGVKTVAYEIWEQLGFRAPANVVAPIGFGSSVLGLYRGFKELLGAGQVERLPRIFACQAANCAPIHSLFAGGSAQVESRPTAAEGIACLKPIRLPEIMRALKESGGQTVAVSEDDIARGLQDLAATRGLFVEPTSAVAPAGARMLLEAGVIRPGEVTVVLLTGNGLKATEKIARLAWGEGEGT
ncbi:MAG: pyridoxal-5-phosphate-dependent protein subunit beta [Ramlibacter sp.]|jgi:threonine synthase|nr:pyridoxal-5-phosphate-dependent protein subunit beta [Ramlibacter sp.]